jgi:hypothetical protein
VVYQSRWSEKFGSSEAQTLIELPAALLPTSSELRSLNHPKHELKTYHKIIE